MLRAYQLSATARGAHDSTSPWTLKDRSDVDPSVRGRTVSTHILGLGIVLVGVLFLAIGLIMGFEFPKYVYEKNKEAQCVLHTDHENYRSWQRGTQWNRKVKLYYWTMVNKDQFLYNKQKPQFRQRGPFVYIQSEVKKDIEFAVTEVYFRRIDSFVFDQSATHQECPDCSEFEKITILSPWHQKLVHENGGEKGLAWTHIPFYVVSNLVSSGLAVDDHGSISFRPNISLLGGFHSSNALTERPLADFSLGSWLSGIGDPFKSVIESNVTNSSFPYSEVRAVYKVFSNDTLLAGRGISISNYNTDTNSAIRTFHEECDKWAELACSSTISNAHLSSSSGIGLSECGIARVLHKCHSNFNNDVYSSIVISYLDQTFCPEDGDFCLNFTSMPQETALAYIAALSGFLLNLSDNVLDLVLTSQQTDLVISRNQSDLALGFQTQDASSGKAVVHKGFLASFRTGDPTSGDESRWKTFTCLQNRNTGNNMKLKEYNGHNRVPEGLLKPGAARVSLTSQTDFTASCPKLRACATCSAPGHQLKFFAEELMRAVTFDYKGGVEYRSVDLQNYTISDSTFTNESHILAADGFQDLTSLTGYMSWASLPHITTDAFSISDDTVFIGTSEVLVESVTGKVWRKSFRWQMNIGVEPSSADLLGRSIASASTGVALPVFWLNRVAEISDGEVGDYKHLVTRLMAVSCGGLIGFSILAVITAIIGVIICFYPSKPNRVLPVTDDPVSTASTGRHP